MNVKAYLSLPAETELPSTEGFSYEIFSNITTVRNKDGRYNNYLFDGIFTAQLFEEKLISMALSQMISECRRGYSSSLLLSPSREFPINDLLFRKNFIKSGILRFIGKELLSIENVEVTLSAVDIFGDTVRDLLSPTSSPKINGGQLQNYSHHKLLSLTVLGTLVKSLKHQFLGFDVDKCISATVFKFRVTSITEGTVSHFNKSEIGICPEISIVALPSFEYYIEDISTSNLAEEESMARACTEFYSHISHQPNEDKNNLATTMSKALLEYISGGCQSSIIFLTSKSNIHKIDAVCSLAASFRRAQCYPVLMTSLLDQLLVKIRNQLHENHEVVQESDTIKALLSRINNLVEIKKDMQKSIDLNSQKELDLKREQASITIKLTQSEKEITSLYTRISELEQRNRMFERKFHHQLLIADEKSQDTTYSNARIKELEFNVARLVAKKECLTADLHQLQNEHSLLKKHNEYLSQRHFIPHPNVPQVLDRSSDHQEAIASQISKLKKEIEFLQAENQAIHKLYQDKILILGDIEQETVKSNLKEEPKMINSDFGKFAYSESELVAIEMERYSLLARCTALEEALKICKE